MPKMNLDGSKFVPPDERTQYVAALSDVAPAGQHISDILLTEMRRKVQPYDFPASMLLPRECVALIDDLRAARQATREAERELELERDMSRDLSDPDNDEHALLRRLMDERSQLRAQLTEAQARIRELEG